MQYKAQTIEEYLQQIPQERKAPISQIRESILNKLPKDFEEGISYGMIGYFVPKSIYPEGYHCTPDLPLPYINLASQKNYISLYDMAFYQKEIEQWFIDNYVEMYGKKPNMGKCCVRFSNMEKIPYNLIEELAGKLSAQQWIEYYESTLNNKKK